MKLYYNDETLGISIPDSGGIHEFIILTLYNFQDGDENDCVRYMIDVKTAQIAAGAILSACNEIQERTP